MKYIKRLEEPSSNNKYWVHTTKGGLNSCLLINNNSVLPNCVGYAWGRAYEILKSKPKLSRANAEDWYDYNDGYERGSKPRVGSIICWKRGKIRNGSDGAGHVSVVEEVYDDESILVSHSSYNGKRFWTKVYKSPYNIGSTYKFQGFIYLPIDVEETSDNSKTIKELANEVIKGKWGNNPLRKEKILNAGYDYNKIQKEVNNMLNNKILKTSFIYNVQKGDTLSSIAKKYNTTWVKIYEDNKNIIGNDPDLIKIGQKLTIN